MSFFMDGVGLEKLMNFAANVAQTGMKKSEPQSDSQQNKEVESDNFELSDNFEKRKRDLKTGLEKVQEGKSILDTAENGVVSIEGFLGKISEFSKKAQNVDISEDELKKINDSIKENLDGIQKVSDGNKFGDKKLLNGSSYNNIRINTETGVTINISSGLNEISLKSLGLSESKDSELTSSDDAKTIEEKAKEALDDVKSRHEKINEDQKILEKTINDLSSIDSIMSEVDPNGGDKSAANLKKSVLSGILIDPEKVLRSQIKSMDEHLIFALLQVHS